jgi:HAD superfamily hydrolase (TIGR01549 family)
MDQTLVDLGVDWATIKQYFVDQYQYRHGTALPYSSFLQIFHWIQDHHGDTELLEYLQYLEQKEGQDAAQFAKPMWLLTQGLDILRQYCHPDIQFGVVSSNFHRTLDIVLQKFHASSQFRIIIGRDDVKTLKPNPEGIHTALSRLQIEPEKCIYLGDMDSDRQAAEAAGVKFIFVQDLQQIFSTQPTNSRQ